MHEPTGMQGLAIGRLVADPNLPQAAEEGSLAPGERLATPPFAAVYEAHFDLVWRALRRYGVEPPELDDAVQEVFVVVHDKLSSFEGRSTRSTWIYGIARRVARDHRPDGRLEVREPALLDELPQASGGDADGNLEAREHQRLLYALLEELAPEHRELLVLVELDELTVAEAAVVLDQNPNTLSSRLRLGRRELAEAWERRRAHADWRRRCATMTRP